MREALKLALEALNHYEKAGLATVKTIDAITAINKALAQLEQEPRAWINWSALTGEPRLGWECESELASEPLYDTPPQRKPLTRGQIREIEVDVSLNPSFDYITPAEQLCRAIEAAHGIKEQK